MNLLYICKTIDSRIGGGHAAYACGVINELVDRKCVNKLIIVAENIKGMEGLEETSKVKIYGGYGFNYKNIMSWILLLIKILITEKPDKIILNTITPFGPIIRTLNIFKKLPYYILIHGAEYLLIKSTLKHKLVKFMFVSTIEQSSGVIWNSEYTRSFFNKHFRNIRGVMIPLGLPVKFSIKTISCDKIRCKYEAIAQGRKSIKLLTVSRLVERKGICDVIMGVKILLDNNLDVKLTIVGDGPMRKEIENLINSLNINKRVELRGGVNDDVLSEIYDNADIFVLCPHFYEDDKMISFEGFGLVYLEAMAKLLPVIGTESGGITTAVVNGRTGLLVQEKSPQKIAKAIMKIANDSVLAQQMICEAVNRITLELNWREYVNKLFGFIGNDDSCENIKLPSGGGVC